MGIDNEYITIGKIGATYGIKGWFKVISFTDSMLDILDYSPWFIEDHQGWRLVELEAAKPYNNGIIAKFKCIDNPETARLLTNKQLAVQRQQLATLQANEFYWSDLEGLTVIDQHQQTLGVVSYLIATGSNDVLVVKGTKEIAIPFLPGDVVTLVDLKNKVIHVVWDLL